MEEPISGSMDEEPQEKPTAQGTDDGKASNVPFSSMQSYYPDPKGMRSRPYPITKGRPYPELEEGKVVYRSEKGRGTYPFSIVQRFSDVIEYEGFPVTPTPPWVKPEDKP
eukprot:6473014-Amphidinium_carterae.1